MISLYCFVGLVEYKIHSVELRNNHATITGPNALQSR